MLKIDLNEHWLFTEGFDIAMTGQNADTSEMQPVRLPHSSRNIPFNYVEENACQLLCVYRREIEVDKAWRSGHILLVFEGAAHEAVVYINGQRAAAHYGAYTGFSVDMVPYLTEGTLQTVCVRVDSRKLLNQPPFGIDESPMVFGGLYREVHLEIKPEIYIEDIYAATPDVLRADKCLKTDVILNQMADGLILKQQLRPWTEQPACRDEIIPLEASRVWHRTSCLTHFVPDVLLWDVDEPNLYLLDTVLYKDGEKIDEKTVRFGFREAQFYDDGFFLNGEPVKLWGLNRLQVYPYSGYAMPKSPQQLDADLLRYALSVNVVRTPDGPPSHWFLDRCDEVGLMVISAMPAATEGTDRQWKKIAVRQCREMAAQNRNHPSVILWDIGADVQDKTGFYHTKKNAVYAMDVYRQTAEEAFFEHEFMRCKTQAGPVDSGSRQLKQVLGHAKALNRLMKDKRVTGAAGWCMTDYLSKRESISGDGLCYEGMLDAFRNIKPVAALYQSQGNNEVVCQVLTSGYEKCGSGQTGTAIFTNADAVRMYQNDNYIREYLPDRMHFDGLAFPPVVLREGLKSHCRYRFDAVIEGEVISTTIVGGAAGDVMLRITADRMVLEERESYDVATVHIEAVDRSGSHLAHYHEAVRLETSGNIELLGPSVIALKGGFSGTYIRSAGHTGQGILTVKDHAGAAEIVFDIIGN